VSKMYFSSALTISKIVILVAFFLQGKLFGTDGFLYSKNINQLLLENLIWFVYKDLHDFGKWFQTKYNQFLVGKYLVRINKYRSSCFASNL